MKPPRRYCPRCGSIHRTSEECKPAGPTVSDPPADKKIKLCPFCGEMPRFIDNADRGPGYVYCNNPRCGLQNVGFSLPTWNDRPSENRLRAQRDRFKIGLKKLAKYASEAAAECPLLTLGPDACPHDEEEVTRAKCSYCYLKYGLRPVAAEKEVGK